MGVEDKFGNQPDGFAEAMDSGSTESMAAGRDSGMSGMDNGMDNGTAANQSRCPSACSPDQPATSAQCLQLLEECHSFPGPYTFKVIGQNTPGWDAAAVSALRSVLGQVDIECLARQTSGGAYTSLTLNTRVNRAGDVLAAYEALRGLPGLKMLL